MATQFRKKPLTISAERWTGSNEAVLIAFTGGNFRAVPPEERADYPNITGSVFDVLHSTWVGVETGQWVIRGVNGEFYPIDESVLAETYDRLPTEPSEAA